MYIIQLIVWQWVCVLRLFILFSTAFYWNLLRPRSDLVSAKISNWQLISSAYIFNSQNWISARILRVCKHEFRALKLPWWISHYNLTAIILAVIKFLNWKKSNTYTVNWLLFIKYQFSSFSLVPAMTKLRTDKYKYTFTGLELPGDFGRLTSLYASSAAKSKSLYFIRSRSVNYRRQSVK